MIQIFGDLRRWDLGSSGLWWHSQEPVPSPRRRGPRGLISRAPRRRRSGWAPAGLARHPAWARGWWPWSFVAECLRGDIVEVRRCPGNSSHGARSAASRPSHEPSASRSRWDHIASRLHEAFPPEATRKRPSYRSALGLVWLQTDGLFEGLQKEIFGCGLPRPLRNRRHARGASRVAFLRRLGAAVPGRRSRWPGRPDPQAGRGRFPEWGGALCRPRPRWSHGEWTSVSSFRASTLYLRSGDQACWNQDSEEGRPLFGTQTLPPRLEFHPR